MVAHSKLLYITPEEYLQRESTAETKSEYVDGVIVAMSGSSPEHAAITFNLALALGPTLQTTGCRGFSADLRVRVELFNRYYYPDLSIVCNKPIYETRHGFQHLLDPEMLFEVLSDSTELRDRGEKWLAYCQIESLNAYILIHQDRPLIEYYTRRLDSQEWVYAWVTGLESALQFPSMGCSLSLAKIYRDVDFTALTPTPPHPQAPE